jgi:tRNA pseudouridine55 synthase
VHQHRKSKARAISGWLVLDKPVGMGSTEAVARIKWLYGAEKAGHAGTLDPLASGMLPVALGEATKTVPYVMDGTKIYRFTASWGEERTTDDLEGSVTKTSGKRPSCAEIEALRPKYTGVIMQVPPQFSAIRVDGERAYDIARDGETVALEAREVEIDRIAILNHTDNTTEFEVECSKGTYVRSLARDMGRDLGCYGHVSALRRVAVFPFAEDSLIAMERIDALVAQAERAAPVPPRRPRGEQVPPQEREAAARALEARCALLDPLLLPVGEALKGLPRVELNADQASRLRFGNPVLLAGRDAPAAEDEACAFQKGRLVAIGEVAFGQFKPRRVFAG